MKIDLSMVYVIRAMLRSVKKEMEENKLTFDEFLEHYDNAVEIMEKVNKTA